MNSLSLSSASDGNDTVEVMLDPVGYAEKPPKKNPENPAKGNPEYGAISNRLSVNQRTLTLEELAEAITNGHAFCPGVMSGGKRNIPSWTAQYLFALDFDDYWTIPLFMETCNRWDITPRFVYPSFSHREDDHRFRAIFVPDQVITDPRLASLVLDIFYRMFTIETNTGKISPGPAQISISQQCQNPQSCEDGVFLFYVISG